ncbi:hypothetical protein BJ138DRAFT_1114788 [Hygrophoropsis aurantiaca]|uniref:Uncharacterized protein n=1 Tax=Hygrophoropsis aurantiaca TaxID=72124 RepID=A0ACB8A8D9_9AGAM|nr:hypothetical protein BJ138DRAFT_1114788 [Hygrophoropsis aurantiaca]
MSSSALYYTVQPCALHGGHSSSTVNPRDLMVSHNSSATLPPDCKCRRYCESYDYLFPGNASPQDILAASQTRSVTPQRIWIDEQDLIDAHRNTPDGKLHVYKCMWGAPDAPGCGMWVEGARIKMSRHLQNYHGIGSCDKTSKSCCWNGCKESIKGESMARHILTNTHLGVKICCSACKTPVARDDAFYRHVDNMRCQNAKQIPLPGPGSHTVNSHTIFGPP